MLAHDHVAGDLEALLAEWDCDVELPCDAEEFFSKTGPLPALFDDRRHYQRYYYRHKALLTMTGTLPAFPRSGQVRPVYTRDISRQGVGFLCDLQLYPKESLLILLPNRLQRGILVANCRRLSAKCYEVGATFAAGSPEVAAV